MATFYNFDRHKIPPSLELAELHYSCNKIGQPISLDKLQDINSIKICPCCFSLALPPYSICADYRNFANYGTTLPLFFEFLIANILILLIMLIGASINQVMIIIKNCRNSEVQFCGFSFLSMNYIDVERDLAKSSSWIEIA